MCKVRGMTLNYSTSQLVNFDSIKDMILKGAPPVTVHADRMIKRTRGGGEDGGACVSIITEPEDKIYRISFYKRRRRDNNTSVPFGYK